MSRKRKKNRDYLPFEDVEENNGFMGIPLGYDDYEEILKMSLSKRLGKIIVPKKYDVSFTYTMSKPYADSKEEAKRFNEVSEKFEKAVVDLISEMMVFCSHIDMEVER